MNRKQTGTTVKFYPELHRIMVYSHWLGPEPGPGQGPGGASINQWKHFQDLENGYQTHSSGPENIPSVLIQKILPGPGPGPSQCEYTIIEQT